MKRFLTLFASILLIGLAGCSDSYDDTEVWDSIHSLEKRLSAMETVMNAYKNKLHIDSVDQIADGYIITFSDGSKATITNGKDGQNGTDGKDGQDGEDGETLIQSIEVSEDEVTFHLTDGRSFAIPLYSMLKVTLFYGDDDPHYIVAPNSRYGFRVEIESILPNVQAEVVASGNIKAVIDPLEPSPFTPNALSGMMTMYFPETISEEYDKVILFVTNGERLVMRKLTFEEGVLQCADNAQKTVTPEGGVLDLEILTNLDYKIAAIQTSPGNPIDWIVPITTRAAEKHIVQFQVEPNNTPSFRNAEIQLQASNGNGVRLSITYKITQDSSIELPQRAILLEIYKGLGIDWAEDPTNLTKPLYEWPGVAGRDEEGWITSFRLWGGTEDNPLGALPPAIGDLTRLQHLTMANTQLTGSLPKEIGKLKELKTINFRHCKLSGSLPEELADCTSLEYLDVGNNQLTGTLPQRLGLLPNLFYVSTENNQLSGDIPQSVLNNQKFWRTCWWGILKGNHFNTNAALHIKAPQIEVTDIQGNSINTSQLYADHEYTILFEFDITDGPHAFLPFAQRLKKIYADWNQSKDIQFIGIVNGIDPWKENVSITKDQITSFIEQEQLDWMPIIINGGNYGNDICYGEGYVYDARHNAWGSAWDSRDMSGQDNIIKYRTICSNRATRSATVVNSSGEVVWSNSFDEDTPIFTFFYQCYGQPAPDPLDGVVTTLQEATEGRGINLVLMGDGFTKEEIESGEYEQKMKNIMEDFFSKEPTASFRHLFNVYAINTVSAQKGYEDGGFSALLGIYDDGYFIYDEYLYDAYISNALNSKQQETLIAVIIPNAERYNGAGTHGLAIVPYHNRYDSARQFLVLHEAAGHALGRLGDEYIYVGGTISDSQRAIYEKGQRDNKSMLNLSFTSDPAKVPWSHFLTDERYANEGLGVYEGALYHFGVYRCSMETSLMSSGGVPAAAVFNAPSREAIYYHIHKLAFGDDWEYDFEKFVEYDAINRKNP